MSAFCDYMGAKGDYLCNQKDEAWKKAAYIFGRAIPCVFILCLWRIGFRLKIWYSYEIRHRKGFMSNCHSSINITNYMSYICIAGIHALNE